MAAATVTKTSYGWYVTGDTDATTVTTDQAFVRRIIYVPQANDNALALTDNDGTSILSTIGPDADRADVYDVGGEIGTRYLGISATLGNGADLLYIIVR